MRCFLLTTKWGNDSDKGIRLEAVVACACEEERKQPVKKCSTLRQRTVKLSYGESCVCEREIKCVCVCVCVCVWEIKCVCVFRMKNKVAEALSHRSIPSVYDAKQLSLWLRGLQQRWQKYETEISDYVFDCIANHSGGGIVNSIEKARPSWNVEYIFVFNH